MFFISKRAFEKAVEKKMWEVECENQKRENHFRICCQLEELDKRVGQLETVVLRLKRKVVRP